MGNESQLCFYPNLPPIRWSAPFFVIGLTGAIAAGKSRAAAFFQEAGAKLVDADRSARKIVERGPVQTRLSQLFGKKITLEDGSISRKALAKIVFSDPEKQALLNGVVHPLVQIEFQKTCRALKSGEILIYDAPLLFETKSKVQTDLSIVVDAPQQSRYERALRRNAWSKEEFLLREQSQFSTEKKRQLADLVLVNRGGLKELQEAVQRIYKTIQEKRL